MSLESVLFCGGMLLVTVALQFFLFKTNRNVSFWSGMDVVIIMCVLGLISNDISYLAGLLGYAVGDQIGRFAGWHAAKK